MVSLMQTILASLARKIVQKYNPKIIGITGSVGKTSARNAIFLAVSGQFQTRQTEKNYNNEFGVPLTIIGAHAPGRSIVAWLQLFTKAISLILLPHDYPKVLVLEMGVDHPGDMSHLLSIAQPNIGVLTYVGLAHYEFFKSAEAVAEEKGQLLKGLKPGGVAIVNHDNVLAYEQAQLSDKTLVSYGIENNSDVKLESSSENFGLPVTTELRVKSKSQNYSISLPVLGRAHVYAVLSAIAVAETLGIHKDVIEQGLLNYRPVAGRMNVFSGLKRSIILDDSYNASPDSVKEVLDLVAKWPAEQKMIVLGDMLELGEQSQQAHREIGKLIATINPDYLLTSGSLAILIAEEAIASGLNITKVFSFENSKVTASKALELVKEGMLVIVKGSQGARMERVSKEIMAEPMMSSELLPRQYGKWLTE